MTIYQRSIEETLQMLCSGPELIPRAIFGMDITKYIKEPPQDQPSQAPAEDSEDSEDLDLPEEPEPKIEYDYWLEKLDTLPTSPATWLSTDLESVFWQKRLRCALGDKDSKVSSQVLSKLQNDEVMAVRVAAGGPESIGP